MVRRTIAYWLPAAFAVTVLCAGGLIYVQNLLRAQANDVPVQLAGDVAASLQHGATAADAVGVAGAETDVFASPRPWVAVFDSSRHLVATSAVDLSEFPRSALNTGSMANFTWQPRPGVRQAVVVRRSGSSWVVAGQSLGQAELHKDEAVPFAIVGWLLALAASAVGALAGAALRELAT